MPSHDRPQQSLTPQRAAIVARSSPGITNSLKRSRTPAHSDDGDRGRLYSKHAAEKEPMPIEDRRQAMVKDLYARSERLIARLFSEARKDLSRTTSEPDGLHSEASDARDTRGNISSQPKRPARAIDEDDYGEDDDDDEEAATESTQDANGNDLAKTASSSSLATPSLGERLTLARTIAATPAEQAKDAEDTRKRLEVEKRAVEKAAADTSQTMFYTLETDRDAMLEQAKLDELDRQVETEISGQAGANGTGSGLNGAPQQGILSSTNLGASSLTLKHLIARIDARRGDVKASDTQLRNLMSEVRRNRSKWASEDKIGQEELYEAAESVLMELKSMTDWAAPFLQKVNKRDAPDYLQVIKHPMDLGTMIKKLKQLQYKSTKEFVDDLDLIWANCLKYNADPNHFLRKKAEHMKKATAPLTKLIPEIVIKDRAEWKAEQERAEHEFDDGEESDEEPIIASRGRKAPAKSNKGSSTARKAPPAAPGSSTPIPETKPQLGQGVGVFANPSHDHLRSDADSVTEGSQLGLSTPLLAGTSTPFENGVHRAGSHADMSELDSNGASALANVEEPIQDDEDYKTWKHVTKKDRARVAAERHRLFRADRVDPEQPALLRTKACMRKWARMQQQGLIDGQLAEQDSSNADGPTQLPSTSGATLAENMNEDGEYVLPDYYDPLSAIPHTNPRLEWKVDSEGYVIETREECLRIVPKEHFKSPLSSLATRVEGNMRQMQDTRKMVAKIGIVKQMQLQSQTYQNQFQKYEPEPFVEVDVEPVVASDDGPTMSPYLCRAALQRTVGKLFYHAGFEEFQPSALESITDLAGDYFSHLVRTVRLYKEAPKVYRPAKTATDASASVTGIASATTTAIPTAVAVAAATVDEETTPETGRVLQPRFTLEEIILHTLQEHGHALEDLENYVSDDVVRLSAKLEAHHVRTKDYLAELLRPALDPAAAGADGAGAFNDGSEQFVGGDFAEDIDEDFFGFKELGLDREFGMMGMSVPLHLLQSRVHSAYQPANPGTVSPSGIIMEPPAPYVPVSADNVDKEIGLVRQFFRTKLDAAGAEGDEPLVEDDELPAKHRFPKPRLPPTGKISSPRKRPIREQQQMARKKRRLELEAEREREKGTSGEPSTDTLANGTSNVNGSTTAEGPATKRQKMSEDEADTSSHVNGVQGPAKPNDTTYAATDSEHSKPSDQSNVSGEAQQKLLKVVSKPKLDPPSQKKAVNGDPEKKDHANEKEATDTNREKDADKGKKKDNDGEDANSKADENEKTNGILSPESMPIAAH